MDNNLNISVEKYLKLVKLFENAIRLSDKMYLRGKILQAKEKIKQELCERGN